MKRYLKSFIPDFRPAKGPDASFDLREFQDKEYRCPITDEDTGVYIITATDGTKYVYPNGLMSPIIYIGMSDRLLSRIKDGHYTKGLKRLLRNPDWGIDDNKQLASRYQYMYYNGSHVDVFKCWGYQDAKYLESMIMNQFYQTYRAIPVGNGARSFCK